MSELFEMEESLSPKMAWLREHSLHVIHGRDLDEDEPVVGVFGPQGLVAEGADEDTALTLASRKLGLKLWFERGAGA